MSAQTLIAVPLPILYITYDSKLISYTESFANQAKGQAPAQRRAYKPSVERRNHFMIRVIRTGFLLVLFLSAALSANAQTAQVSGRISDPQRALVQGAQVRVVNQATNLAYETTSNADGYYLAPFLAPGVYKITVTAKGFRVAESKPMSLNVGQHLLFDVQLMVGGPNEEVVVKSGLQLVNTTDATVGTVVEQPFVADIPLNGRSFQDLISLAPGVVTQSPQAYSGQGFNGDFSVNGQRTESNNYFVDGVSANTGAGAGDGSAVASTGGLVGGSTVLGTTQSLISLDAMQEFRTDTSNYSAEYGRAPGGQFLITTRSGTNQYHGSAYDYLRNNFFDANDWFNDYYGVPQPALRQNDFGGTFGGPLTIPGLYNGRDRTFFFVSYEGLRLMLPQAASLSYVPSTSLRSAAPTALQPILNAFPAPTGAEVQIPCDNVTYNCPSGSPVGTLVPSGLAPFTAAFSDPSHVNSISVRVDENLSSRMSVFFRYGVTPSVSEAQNLSVLGGTHSDILTYTTGVTNQISNRINNNFRLGYSHSNEFISSVINAVDGATPINLAEATGLGQYPNAKPYFYMNIAGVGRANLSTSNSSNVLNQWNVVDSVDVSMGRHQLKFGADFRHFVSPLNHASPTAYAEYTSSAEVLSNSANFESVEQYLPGKPAFNQFALYAQDQWRVTSRLALSLGLRWDIDPAPHAANGTENDAYTLTEGSTLSNPVVAPQGTPLFKTSYFNVAPRLGAAYQIKTSPGWETVIRGGGGVFFATDNDLAATGFEYALGFYAYQGYSGSGLPFTQNMLNFSVPGEAGPYTGTTINAFPTHLQLPYTLQWNLSLQQALGGAQAFTISYLGNSGRRLLLWRQIDESANNPNFNALNIAETGNTSDYDALQVQFRRSVGHGLQALASYTWSHSIDDGSAASALPTTRGNSDFDVRHNFQAGLTWDLPGAGGNRVAEYLISHWGLDARFMARTGFPVFLYGNFLEDASGNYYYSGVDLVPNTPLYLHGSEYPGGQSINPAAFSLPNGNDSGDAPRNFARGLGENQINLSVRREFPIKENVKLQFRAEAFNVLNHPNFGIIDAYLGDPTFGQALSMLNQSLGTVAPQYQQGGPRSMQFMLKLVF